MPTSDEKAGAVRLKKMPRRKLAHVTQQCAFAGAPKVGEIIAERLEIQTGADARNID
jgi:hypothetical protein